MLVLITVSIATGMPDRTVLGLGGSALTCLYSAAGYPSTGNGFWPVSISCSTQPRA